MICNLPDLEIWMLESGYMEPNTDITQAIIDIHAAHQQALAQINQILGGE